MVAFEMSSVLPYYSAHAHPPGFERAAITAALSRTSDRCTWSTRGWRRLRPAQVPVGGAAHIRPGYAPGTARHTQPRSSRPEAVASQYRLEIESCLSRAWPHVHRTSVGSWPGESAWKVVRVATL